jgi:3-oxoacyl-[acyl-carrier-protein] synthase II
MPSTRVVVTGVGLVSPLGNTMEAVGTALVGQHHGIRKVEDWRRFAGLEARVGGIAHEFEVQCRRKELRNMGRVAMMSVAATRAALDDAGLDEKLLHAGAVSLFYGSTDGSTAAAEDYYRKLYTTDSFGSLLSSTYLKFMSHTCAANLAQVFGVTGRVVPRSVRGTGRSYPVERRSRSAAAPRKHTPRSPVSSI